MSTGVEPHRCRLRAPQASGSTLIDPPLEEAAAVAAGNVDGRRQLCYDLQGRCLSEVSRQARRELVAEAFRRTSSYRDVDPIPAEAQDAAIFLAGHQPQLFHPGVWFKNFALAALARQQGAIAVNLLIDTDTFRQNTLAVPGGAAAHPQRRFLALDLSSRPLPFEERAILDRQLFTTFGRRAARQLKPLVADPLIRDYWPMVQERMRETGNLGACLAQSRHQLEGRWGLSTLEIPESVVCASQPFGWFMAHLLAQLPRFRSIYNEAVRQYRLENRIRSAAHPAPDLAADGSWLEAPFWIWTADNPVRRRLFAKLGRDRIELCDREGVEITLSLGADGTADRAVEQLAELAAAGVKIRPRALVTTLWARLALGDLFVHGIGGAKYDRVTDVLCQRFFGLEPPRFFVVSGTLHLPVTLPEASQEDLRRIRHQLRDLTFHPQLSIDPSAPHSDGAEDPGELIAAKRRWIAAAPSGAAARQRFLEIRRINQALQPWVAPLRRRLEAERDRLTDALRTRSILCWREYAFCFHPEKTLQNFLGQLLPKSG